MRNRKCVQLKMLKANKIKKKVLSSSSSDSSANEDEDLAEEEEDAEIELDLNSIQCNEFIIVRYISDSTKIYDVHYIAKILALKKSGYEVIFLRRHGISNRFAYPLLEDKQKISREQIVKKLKQPQASNKRCNFLIFNIGQLNVSNLR